MESSHSMQHPASLPNMQSAVMRSQNIIQDVTTRLATSVSMEAKRQEERTEEIAELSRMLQQLRHQKVKASAQGPPLTPAPKPVLTDEAKAPAFQDASSMFAQFHKELEEELSQLAEHAHSAKYTASVMRAQVGALRQLCSPDAEEPCHASPQPSSAISPVARLTYPLAASWGGSPSPGPSIDPLATHDLSGTRHFATAYSITDRGVQHLSSVPPTDPAQHTTYKAGHSGQHTLSYQAQPANTTDTAPIQPQHEPTSCSQQADLADPPAERAQRLPAHGSGCNVDDGGDDGDNDADDDLWDHDTHHQGANRTPRAPHSPAHTSRASRDQPPQTPAPPPQLSSHADSESFAGLDPGIDEPELVTSQSPVIHTLDSSPNPVVASLRAECAETRVHIAEAAEELGALSCELQALRTAAQVESTALQAIKQQRHTAEAELVRVLFQLDSSSRALLQQGKELGCDAAPAAVVMVEEGLLDKPRLKRKAKRHSIRRSASCGDMAAVFAALKSQQQAAGLGTSSRLDAPSKVDGLRASCTELLRPVKSRNTGTADCTARSYAGVVAAPGVKPAAGSVQDVGCQVEPQWSAEQLPPGLECMPEHIKQHMLSMQQRLDQLCKRWSQAQQQLELERSRHMSCQVELATAQQRLRAVAAAQGTGPADASDPASGLPIRRPAPSAGVAPGASTGLKPLSLTGWESLVDEAAADLERLEGLVSSTGDRLQGLQLQVVEMTRQVVAGQERNAQLEERAFVAAAQVQAKQDELVKLQQEVQEHTAAAQAAQQAASAAQASLLDVQAALTSLQHQHASGQEQLQQLVQEQLDAGQQVAATLTELAQTKQEQQALALEVEAAQKSRDSLAMQVTDLLLRVSELEKETADQQVVVESAREELRQLEAQQVKAQQQVKTSRDEVQGAGQEVGLLATARQEAEAAVKAAQAELAALVQEKERVQAGVASDSAQHASTQQELEKLREVLAETQAEVDRHQESAQAWQQTAQKHHDEATKMQQEAAAAGQKLLEADQQLARVKVQVAAADQQLKEVQQAARLAVEMHDVARSNAWLMGGLGGVTRAGDGVTPASSAGVLRTPAATLGFHALLAAAAGEVGTDRVPDRAAAATQHSLPLQGVSSSSLVASLLQQEVTSLQAALTSAETRARVAEGRLLGCEDQLQVLQAQHNALRQAHAKARAGAGLAGEAEEEVARGQQQATASALRGRLFEVEAELEAAQRLAAHHKARAHAAQLEIEGLEESLHREHAQVLRLRQQALEAQQFQQQQQQWSSAKQPGRMSRLMEVEAEVEEVEQQLRRTKNQVDRQQQLKVVLEGDCQALQARCSSLREQLNGAAEEQQAARQQLAHAKQALQQAQQQQDEAHAHLLSLQQEVQSLQDARSQEQQRLQHARTSCADVEASIQELQHMQVELEQVVVALQQQVSTLKDTAEAEAQAAYRKATRTVAAATSPRPDLAAGSDMAGKHSNGPKGDARGDTREGLAEQPRQAQVMLITCQAELDACQAELAACQQQLAAKDAELAAHKRTVTCCKEQASIQLSELHACKAQLAASQDELAACQQKLAGAAEQMQELQQEAARAAHAAQHAEASQSVLKAQAERASSELAASLEELALMQLQCAGLQQHVRAASVSKITTLDRSCQTDLVEVSTAAAQPVSCTHSMDHETQLQELHKSVGSAQEQLDQLNRSIAESEQQLASLQQGSAAVQAEREALQAQVDGLLQEKEGLEGQMAELCAQQLSMVDELRKSNQQALALLDAMSKSVAPAKPDATPAAPPSVKTPVKLQPALLKPVQPKDVAAAQQEHQALLQGLQQQLRVLLEGLGRAHAGASQAAARATAAEEALHQHQLMAMRDKAAQQALLQQAEQAHQECDELREQLRVQESSRRAAELQLVQQEQQLALCKSQLQAATDACERYATQVARLQEEQGMVASLRAGLSATLMETEELRSKVASLMGTGDGPAGRALVQQQREALAAAQSQAAVYHERYERLSQEVCQLACQEQELEGGEEEDGEEEELRQTLDQTLGVLAVSQRRVAELEKLLEEAQQVLSEQGLEEQQTLATLDRDLAVAKETVIQLQAELQAARAAEQQHEAALQAAQQECDTLRQKCDQCEREAQESKDVSQNLQKRLDEADVAFGQLQQQVCTLQEAAAQQDEQQQAASALSSAQQVEIEELRAETTSKVALIQQLQAGCADLQQQLVAANAQVAESKAQLDQYLQEQQAAQVRLVVGSCQTDAPAARVYASMQTDADAPAARVYASMQTDPVTLAPCHAQLVDAGTSTDDAAGADEQAAVSESVSDLQQRLSQLQAEVAAQEQVLGDLAVRERQLKSEADRHRLDVDAQSRRAAMARAELQQDTASASAALHQQQLQVTQLSAQCAEVERAVGAAQARLQAAQAQEAAAVASCAELRQHSAALRQELRSEMQGLTQMLGQTSEQWVSHRAQMQRDCDELQDQRISLMTDVMAARSLMRQVLQGADAAVTVRHTVAALQQVASRLGCAVVGDWSVAQLSVAQSVCAEAVTASQAVQVAVDRLVTEQKAIGDALATHLEFNTRQTDSHDWKSSLQHQTLAQSTSTARTGWTLDVNALELQISKVHRSIQTDLEIAATSTTTPGLTQHNLLSVITPRQMPPSQSVAPGGIAQPSDVHSISLLHSLICACGQLRSSVELLHEQQVAGAAATTTLYQHSKRLFMYCQARAQLLQTELQAMEARQRMSSMTPPPVGGTPGPGQGLLATPPGRTGAAGQQGGDAQAAVCASEKCREAWVSMSTQLMRMLKHTALAVKQTRGQVSRASGAGTPAGAGSTITSLSSTPRINGLHTGQGESQPGSVNGVSLTGAHSRAASVSGQGGGSAGSISAQVAQITQLASQLQQSLGARLTEGPTAAPKLAPAPPPLAVDPPQAAQDPATVAEGAVPVAPLAVPPPVTASGCASQTGGNSTARQVTQAEVDAALKCLGLPPAPLPILPSVDAQSSTPSMSNTARTASLGEATPQAARASQTQPPAVTVTSAWAASVSTPARSIVAPGNSPAVVQLQAAGRGDQGQGLAGALLARVQLMKQNLHGRLGNSPR